MSANGKSSGRPPERRGRPKPVYERDGIRLYCGDWRDHLDLFDEAAVIVTDPPYGVSYDSKRAKRERIVGDKTTEIRDALLEEWGERPALVFGTWRAQRPICRALLIWAKGKSPGMGDLSLPWGPAHEEIYVRGKGWTKPDKRRPDVLDFKPFASRGARRPDHPTPKPTELMIHLLERCPPGLVLDPFAGSGATLLAARHLGREAIGIEMEFHYCELTAKRLEESL